MLPLATATILSIILSPVMIRLEPYFGRLFSAVLVVLTVIMVIAGIGYVLTVPLSNVADQVAGYSENIGNKLAALEQSTPPWVQHVQDAVSDVQRRVQKAAPSQHNPRTVIALPSPSSPYGQSEPVFPILDAIDLLTAQTALANASAQQVQSRWQWYTSLSQLAHDAGVLGVHGDTPFAFSPDSTVSRPNPNPANR